MCSIKRPAAKQTQTAGVPDPERAAAADAADVQADPERAAADADAGAVEGAVKGRRRKPASTLLTGPIAGSSDTFGGADGNALFGQ
jgi:hypothetical protein